MARAKRFYLPGLTWHITQRCHKKEYLLGLKRHRDIWLHWLEKANNRFDISILNYMITSNHIHLLVMDGHEECSIANSMQLVSGRMAQEYNNRNNRSGAFWGDRYHGTAVQENNHLFNCMMYMDTNMVRAGKVKHPKEWTYCGYQEIEGLKQKNTLINKKKLSELFEVEESELRSFYNEILREYMANSSMKREPRWTESIAVGQRSFVESIKKALGDKAKKRKIVDHDDYSELK